MSENLDPDFTREELAAFLEGLGNQGQPLEGYRTQSEWCEYLGLPRSQMTRKLYQAQARGWLIVRRDKRKRIDGTVSYVPVYAFDLEKVQQC